MKYAKIGIILGGALLFSGCCKKLELVDCEKGCQAKPIIQTATFNGRTCTITQEPIKTINNCVFKIEAKGVGAVDCKECSKSKAIAMARRAAILDAYKALAEEVYGIKINGRDSVKNMVLQNSTLKAYVEGLIRGAKVVDENYKDGIYSVSMELKLNLEEWNNYLKNKREIAYY